MRKECKGRGHISISLNILYAIIYINLYLNNTVLGFTRVKEPRRDIPISICLCVCVHVCVCMY